MPTERLYYESSYLTEFSAKVLACTEDKKGFATVLDKTAFYPEGGGQPFDAGYFLLDGERLEVFEVREKAGDVFHYTSACLPVGATVEGFLNFDRRFDLMQQHTGEHILSGLVRELFGFENVGFHLSDKDMSVDFSGALSAADINMLVGRSNKIILENQPVVASFPLDLENLDYRCKKEIEGKIRIVAAGKADLCACCGTHTSTTGEVLALAVFDSMAYKGGTRLYMACGGRVLKDYMAKNADCYKISHLLSSKVSEIVPSLENKIAENELLRQEIGQLKNQLYTLWVSSVPSGRLGFFEKDNLTAGDVQRVAQLLNEKCEIAVVSAPQECGNVKVCIISSVVDTSLVGRAICEKLTGKGGGKNGIFQCVVQGTAVKAVLESVLDISLD